MRHHITRIMSVSRPWLQNLPRYAIVGAWFFAIVSAVPLIWLMIEGHGSDGSSQVFGTEVNGAVHTVWGLTYAGFFGSVLLWLECFALIAATVLAALPTSFAFTKEELATRMRRIGLGYLTGWAGLWMIGTMYLAALDPGFWIVQALFVAALFVCTLYRAAREWNPKPAVEDTPTPQSQTGPERSADPGYSPLTDIADISRFMLHRSAERHSDRVMHREFDKASPPSRLFISERSAQRTALDDDYGAAARAAASRAARFVKRGLTEGLHWIKRSARTIATTLHDASRSTRSA